MTDLLILDGAVLITSADAVSLLALLDEGLRRRRADGYRLTDQETLIVQSLNYLAKLHRGENPTSLVEPIVWLPLKDAAIRAGVTPEAVRQAARRGTLKSRRCGHRIDVAESSVESWIELRALHPISTPQPNP